ncbi:acyl-[acyl-carrier-protein]--UDP-N-acetylglucosamine O-acyltransferase [Candidatus Endobugula sertula]|uniref:Acyl-[acyl-carrier-protein]--UDP-N-acetylglucosamine O-acyltransferase n=1 Tax=Candidatus Endobugula sertula TaxID=62101 RepID=A0A1D2QQS5_9GAMM|nr:acyl-[acyl-carrier-protein]--UDP-N-acetylglucosamine O-acyltransferase [Candidatus Endobugula sertula]
MIHPQAIIDSSAQIADGVSIGAFSIIAPDVVIGEGTIIEPHVIVKGPTVIGKHNHIYQFSTVGEATPDLKYKGEATRLVIGDHNIIREGVTIHRGTIQDRYETTIGNNNLLMAYVHVGHDSVIGDHCILVNNTALAGHVHIADWAVLGGYTLVHQYCRIGAHCFTGMGSAIGKDVPAFMVVSGSPAEAKTVNSEGLSRRGFEKSEIKAIQKAFKIVYRQNLTVKESLSPLQYLLKDCADIQLLIDSLESSTRGIVR